MIKRSGKKFLSLLLTLAMVLSLLPALALPAKAAAGDTWTTQDSGIINDLNGICYGGSTFVAVGAGGTIITSSNGISWSNRTAANNVATGGADLAAVCYGNGLFMAVGTGGKVITSPDGATWTARNSAPNDLVAVAYGNNAFVALGRNNTLGGYIYTSINNGGSWTQTYLFNGYFLFGTCFGNNQFVVVGDTDYSTSKVLVSADGSSWTDHSTDQAAQSFTSVCYGNSKYVACDIESRVLTSGNGTTWVNLDWQNVPGYNSFEAVCYGGTAFVTVGTGGVVYTSSDGSSWSSKTSNTTSRLKSVCYGNGAYVAAGAGGVVITSGAALSTAPTVTTQAVTNIASTTATGNGSITSLGSPNPTAYGICWNTAGTPTTSDSKVDKGAATGTGAFTVNMTGLTAGTTYYVRAYATNSAGTSYGSQVTFATTAAGDTWAAQTSGVVNNLTGICYGGSTFVAVGEGGKIITSPDGVTWTSRTSGTTIYLHSVSTDGNGTFVAVAGGATTNTGIILTSTNYGVTWSSQAFSAYYARVCYGNGLFMAFADGDCYTSVNGSTWTYKGSVDNYNIFGLAYHNIGGTDTYVGVGYPDDFTDPGGNYLYRIASSTDSGTTWTRDVSHINTLAANLNSVCYGAGEFVAVGDGESVFTSSTGLAGTWTKQTGVASSNFQSICYADGKYIAVGYSYAGSPFIYSSTNGGVSWSPKTPNTTYKLQSVCYGNNTFVAVGANGTILTSAGAPPDTTPPASPTYSPAGSTTNVAVTVKPTLTFGEALCSNAAATAMGPSPTGVIKVYEGTSSAGTALTEGAGADNAHFTVAYNSTTRAFTVTFGASLKNSQSYYIELQANKVYDAAGNGISSPQGVSFTTAAPSVNVISAEIFTNGNPVIIAAGTSGTLIYFDADADGVLDPGEVPLTLTGPSGDTVTGFNLASYNINGTTSSGSVASCKITMLSGQVAAIFGSAPSSGTVTGDTYITMNGGTAAALYGGGNSGGVGGSTHVTMTGGTVGGIVGGCGNNTVMGSTNVTITGGTINGSVYGGGWGPSATVFGNTNVTVTGGTITNSVRGGGNAAAVTGTATVTVGVDAVISGIVSSSGLTGTVGAGSRVIYEIAFYDASGGIKYGNASTYPPQWITGGNKATRPVTDPTRTGFTFAGWKNFSDNSDYDFNSSVSAAAKLYPGWNSTDATLTSVLSQSISAGSEAGTSGAPKTAGISVANTVSAVSASDIVKHDAGATVTFYGTDSTFNTPSGSVSLTAGAGTIVYIKVVAADSTTLHYKVTVNRAATSATVTTQPVSAIASTTATGNGNITSLGSPNPTAYGVCWNTTGTPTTSDSKVDKGAASATGAFTASMTGLSPNTTYHVRAYVTNTVGTSYGDDVTFTTNGIAPSVTTQAVSSIGSTTATGNGTITSLGIPNPTAYGVCWNTTGTPTVSDSKVDKGAASATGAFTASMTGLTASTSYYVRSFATNSAGTSYGTEVQFTTATPLSSDATLKASSTVKGQTVVSLGTPNSALGSVTAGSVTIKVAQAWDTTNAGSFVTLFDKNDTTATVKAVKYASGAPTTGFETDAAYANEAISNGDFFIIKVTAQDATTVKYYRINVTVTPVLDSSATWKPAITLNTALDVIGSGSSSSPVVLTLDGTVTLQYNIHIKSGYVKIIGGSSGGTLLRGSAMTHTAVTPSATQSSLIIVEDGTLTLQNVVLDGNKSSVTANSQLVTLSAYADSTKHPKLVLDSGAILQNNYNANTNTDSIASFDGTKSGTSWLMAGGIGVLASYSTITINSGSIIRWNTGVGYGGAIGELYSGTTHTINMTGGEIYGNLSGAARSSATSAVQISSDGTLQSTFNMSGGRIYGNMGTCLSTTTTKTGAGVANDARSTTVLNFSGNAEVSGNYWKSGIGTGEKGISAGSYTMSTYSGASLCNVFVNTSSYPTVTSAFTGQLGISNQTANGAQFATISGATAPTLTTIANDDAARSWVLKNTNQLWWYSDATLTSVLGQAITAGSEAGTSGAPKTAGISVANAVSSVSAADIVKHDAGATVTFYGTDSTFTTAATGSISLTAGAGTAVYVKVAAADSTALHYKVTINRAAAADTTPPSSPAYSPVSNMTNVAVTVTPTLTFGEALYSSASATAMGASPTGVIKVYEGSSSAGTALTEGAGADNAHYTVAYNATTRVFTVTFGASLKNSQSYYVELQANKVYDAAGNGINTAQGVTFTTVPAAAPTVTAISPASGTTAGGTSVTVTGTNFTGATAILFGGTNASTYTVNSPTQITVVSPAGSAGTVDITVTTPGGTSATSSADQFTYIAPAAAPTVTAVSPASGPASGGTSVIVTGTNFTGATAVRFGGTNASTYTVNSPTQITVVSPAGSAGTVDITVTTEGGTSATSPADRFTYTAGYIATVNTKINGAAADVTGVILKSGATTVTASKASTGVYTASVGAGTYDVWVNGIDTGTDIVIGSGPASANINYYTVTFSVQGGSAVASQTILSGGKAAIPTPPTKSGNNFAGWYTDTGYGTAWNFSTGTISAARTLYAKWEPAARYKVTYAPNGATSGSVPADSASYISGDRVTVKGNTGSLAKSGYTFDRWSSGGTSYTAGQTFTITGDMTLSAVWTPVANTYTVTYSNNFTGGGTYITQSSISSGATLTAPAEPLRGGYTFIGWYKDAAGVSRWNFGADTVIANTTLYAKWTENTYAVDGTVKTDDTVPAVVNGATVKVIQGNVTFGETVTTADGTFVVTGVPNGIYNLVVTKGSQEVTICITVSGNYDAHTVTLPSGNRNSTLEVNGSGTPNVVVDNLNGVFNDSNVFTPTDNSNVNNNGATVEIKLTVQKNDSSTNKATVEATMTSGGYTSGMILDVDMTKTVTSSSGAQTGQEQVTAVSSLITLIIPLPAELQGKASYVVSRAHDYNDGRGTVVDTITTAANGDNERIVVNSDKTQLTLYVMYFSTYAIGYTATSGTTGGGVSSVTYPITATAGAGGTISPTGASVTGGGSVTFTIAADKGYAISDVLVDGKSVGAVGSYTFSSVFAPHTIAAVFAKLSGLPYYLDGNGNTVFIGFSSDAGGTTKYIAPSGAAVSFKDNHKSFTDTSGHWAKPYITFVTEREIFVGTGANQFSPTMGMTRAMFATVIGRLYERSYGPLKVSGNPAFSDCNYSLWYGRYVDWCAGSGIITGVGGGLFAPDRVITRAEMATMLYRFAKFLNASAAVPGGLQLSYPDAAKIDSWASDAAKYCQQTGIITGRDGGAFAPQGTASRAEVATIVNRFVENILTSTVK